MFPLADWDIKEEIRLVDFDPLAIPLIQKKNRYIVSAYLTQFTPAQVLFLTAKIPFTFTFLSAAHIYDFHIFTVTYNDFSDIL